MGEDRAVRSSTYRGGAGAASGAAAWPADLLLGRVCVVTGANRGIGRATAAALTGLGEVH